MRFKDKVALISAAANGIGRATATIMAREGATVIAVDNHQGRLDEAVPALRQAGSQAGGKTEGRLVDALDAGAVDRLVAEIEHGLDLAAAQIAGELFHGVGLRKLAWRREGKRHAPAEHVADRCGGVRNSESASIAQIRGS